MRPADAHRGEHLNLLVADDPYFAFREAVIALHGFRQQPPAGISEQAIVQSRWSEVLLE